MSAVSHAVTKVRRADPRTSGLLFAVASAICFGGSGPVAKPLITAGLTPVQVAWLRVAGGALLMLPFAVRHLDLVRREPRLLLGYGVFAIAGVQVFYFAAIATVPVGVALLIEFLGPLLVLDHIDDQLGADGRAVLRDLLAEYPGVAILATDSPDELVPDYRIWDLDSAESDPSRVMLAGFQLK